MPAEFVVLRPNQSQVTRPLLGLTLYERSKKMLEHSGLKEAASLEGTLPLVLWPFELVGPPTLGAEVADISPLPDEVIAFGSREVLRPAIILGPDVRSRLAQGTDAQTMYENARNILTSHKEPKAPVVEVRDLSSRRKARRVLLNALRKPTDGVVSRTLNRPLSIAMSSLFVLTPITPNQLTLLTFFIAMIGAWFVASQEFVLGTLTLQFASILDGCDGEVARLKYMSSRLGAWLDTVLDDISNMTFAWAIGYGLWKTLRHPVLANAMLVLGVLTVICALIAVSLEYYRVLRRGERVDTGSLTWDNSSNTHWFRRFLINYLAPIVRRDAYYFIFLVLALLGPVTNLITTCLIPVFFFIGAFLAMFTIVTDRNIA